MNADSDDEDEADKQLMSDNSHFTRYSVITKHISVMQYGENFVRLGGKLRISSCVVRPFSFVISEISGINMMLHLKKRRSLEMNTSSDRQGSVDSSPSPPQDTSGKDSIMRSFVITKVDKISETNKFKNREIRVGEELIESPYSFLVPIAFLKFLEKDRLDEYEV